MNKLEPQENLQAVFSQRAQMLATVNDTVSLNDRKNVLVFNVGEEYYGIVSDQLLKIIAEQIVTPIPFAPSIFLGMMYYSGDIWPVLNGGALFQTSNDAISENLILLEHKQQKVALSCGIIRGEQPFDETKELVHLSTEKARQQTLVTGVYDKNIALIDVKKIFSLFNDINMTTGE